MLHPRTPRADDGASIIEYTAMIVLAAVILAGLIAVGGPTRFADGVRDVLCMLLQHRRCPNQSRDLAKRNPDKPSSCLRSQSSAATDHDFKVIAYRRDHNVTTMTRRGSDGSISETTSGQGGNGLDVRTGVGGKAGKGVPSADVTVGAGYLYNSTYATQLDFTGDRGLTPDRQRARYRGLVAERRRTMTNELAMDPERSSDPDFQRRWARIPTDTAHELHIRTTVSRGGGNELNTGIDTSVALAGLDGSSDEDRLTSRSVDDNGTPDRSDDTTTISFTDTEKLNGNAGIEIAPFPGNESLRFLQGKEKLTGEYSPVTGYQVEYRRGRPIELTMTRQLIRSWGAAATYGAGGDRGFGGIGAQRTTGEVSTQTVSTDLSRNPDAYTALRAYLAKENSLPKRRHAGVAAPGTPKAELQRKAAIRTAATHLNSEMSQVGRLSQVDYHRTVTKSGPELSVSRWIELAAGEWTKTNDAWSVQDARYYDRTQGGWVRWTECVQGGAH